MRASCVFPHALSRYALYRAGRSTLPRQHLNKNNSHAAAGIAREPSSQDCHVRKATCTDCADASWVPPDAMRISRTSWGSGEAGGMLALLFIADLKQSKSLTAKQGGGRPIGSNLHVDAPYSSSNSSDRLQSVLSVSRSNFPVIGTI